MTLEDDIAVMKMIDLFSDFNFEHLRLLAFGGQKLAHEDGHELFHEGQVTDGGYVVLSGRVDLVTHSGIEQKLLGSFEMGSLLGEAALITQNKRSGTAVCVGHTTLIKIPRPVMLRVISEYPELAASVRTKLAGSLADLIKNLNRIPAKLSR